MTTPPDEGGESACFAHLVDGPVDVTDALLATLARELADAVVIADPEGRIVFWNASAARVLGWAPAEAIGQTLDLIIPERLRERHWAGYRRTMATGHTDYGDRLLEAPALHRDGRTLSIAFTVTLLRRPGLTQPLAIAAVIRDVTDEWRQRRALRDELAHLRALAGEPPPNA